jgi:hypothetical protein
MAVYRPKRNGQASKFYVCEFVYQGKRFQEFSRSDNQNGCEGVREAAEGRVGASCGRAAD